LALVDVDACSRLSIPVVRRCSGGTAVLQGRDLNLSLALPFDHPWACGIGTLYGRFTEALRDTLALVRVQVQSPSPPFPKDRSRICFEGWGEETLLWGNRKVAGGAQVRRKDAVLVHLTALFTLDAALQTTVFKVPQGRILRALAMLPPRPGLDRETLARAFTGVLSDRLGLLLDERPGPPTS
jgi:lipoate-protein ligase A